MTFVRPSLQRESITNAIELAEQYIAYISTDMSTTTVNNRKHLLLPMLKDLGCDDITELTLFDIDLYMAERTKTDKPTTVSTRRQIARSFFQYCQEYREINLAFHWAAIHRKKVKAPRKVTFERADVVRVMDSCKRTQDRLMIAVLFFTGVRISELLNMRIADIRSTQIQVRGKGSYDRVVHMPQWLAQEIREYLALRADKEGHVFRPLQKHCTHPSTYYTNDKTVRKRLQREFARTIGKEMHPHQLRHSFAVDWLMRGGDLRSLQLIMGHDSIETTQIYLGLTDIQTGDIYARVFAN